MPNEEFDSSILNTDLPNDPDEAQVEIEKLTMAEGKMGPYQNVRNPFHERVCDRVESLYQIRHKRDDERLKDVLPENRSFEHEMRKHFGVASEVKAEGAEAREEWEDERLNEISRKTEGELKRIWGKDYEQNLDDAKFLKETYLSSEEDQKWLETPINGVRPGDDPYLIQKMAELSQYLQKKYWRHMKIPKEDEE